MKIADITLTIARRLAPFYVFRGEPVWNLPGFFSEADIVVYRRLAREVSDTGLIVEIGSWLGRSVINLAKTTPGPHIVAVDTFGGSLSEMHSFQRAKRSQFGVYSDFLRNLRRARVGNVSVLRMTSSLAASLLANDAIDLVFIDADHTYESATEDIATWMPKVRPGGILAGHDYHQGNPVERAVSAALGSRAVLSFEGSSIWAVRKLTVG